MLRTSVFIGDNASRDALYLGVHGNMTIYGEAVAAKFAKRHAGARKWIQRFLEIVVAADWADLAALNRSFPSADLGRKTGNVIFDVCNYKYRLIAAVKFEQRDLLIESVLTRKEYDRETF